MVTTVAAGFVAGAFSLGWAARVVFGSDDAEGVAFGAVPGVLAVAPSLLLCAGGLLQAKMAMHKNVIRVSLTVFIILQSSYSLSGCAAAARGFSTAASSNGNSGTATAVSAAAACPITASGSSVGRLERNLSVFNNGRPSEPL